MTIKELIEKMKRTETERFKKNKEHNGAYGVLRYWYEQIQKSTEMESVDNTEMESINRYKNSISGFIEGIYRAHFISETEFEQLKKELDDIYDMCSKKIFDDKEGESL